MNYAYADEHVKYMTEQVWEARPDLTVYDRLSEYEHNQIGPWLPVQPRVVMDLGCGLGRAAIYLHSVYKDPSIHYILADTNGYVPNTGQWDADTYYNDLALTESFCRLNGLENFRTFDTKHDNWAALPKVDFITSRCAFGMHYSIESVMAQLVSIASPDVTMVFGTRNRELYGPRSFSDMFNSVQFIEQEQQAPYPQQDWLVLKAIRA